MAATKKSSHFTKPPDSAPDSFGPPLIGALLRVPWEAVQEHMLAQLHAEGFTDFDPSYLTVFRYPGPHGERPSELAARSRVSKQALNHLLGQLEQRGYLEREADPEDGRSKRISLTPRGLEAVAVIRRAVAEVEGRWARQLGRKRFDQLRTLLLELNEPAEPLVACAHQVKMISPPAALS